MNKVIYTHKSGGKISGLSGHGNMLTPPFIEIHTDAVSGEHHMLALPIDAAESLIEFLKECMDEVQ